MAKPLDKNKSRGGIGENIRVILYALIIAFFVRSVAYQPFNIPSGSMIPTLLVGDYLFVSKFSYEHTMIALSFESLTTSISNSFHPIRDSSIKTSEIGLASKPDSISW